MKRILIRLLIIINPIHPCKFSAKQLRIIFKIFKGTRFFKWYFFKYLYWFSGSQYQIWLKHKDNSFQCCNILYYPLKNNKACVELWEGPIYKSYSNNIVEVDIKYLFLTR